MKNSALALAFAAIVAGVAALYYDATQSLDQIDKSQAELGNVIIERVNSLELEVGLLKLKKLDDRGPVGERVVTLPNDGGKWHLSIWYANKTTDSASRRLANYFASDPVLQSISTQAIIHEHDASNPDPVFAARYSDQPAPGVLLQNSKGVVVYKATGNNIPTTGAALATEILDSVGIKAQDCPDGNCPLPDDTGRRPLADRRPNRNSQQVTEGQQVALGAAFVLVAAFVAYLLFNQPQQQRPAA